MSIKGKYHSVLCVFLVTWIVQQVLTLNRDGKRHKISIDINLNKDIT